MTKRSLIQQCKLNKIDYKENKIEVDRVTIDDSVSVIFVKQGHVIMIEKLGVSYGQDLIQMVLDAKK